MIYNLTKFNAGWNTRKLHSLGEFARGKSKHRPRNDEALYEGGGYPFIQTGDIKAADLYITSHDQEYNDVGLAQSKLWDAGTLAITIAANIAETSILSYPMCFPDSVVGFTAYPSETTEMYMHYIFAYIRASIQRSVGGSIQDNINIDYLENLDFKIPDKTIQDKMVEMLATIDHKIAINNALTIELEKAAKLIYDYWFTQFDFPDADGKPYRASGGAMEYNAQLKREIPKGWTVPKLSSVVYNITESTRPGEHLQDLPYTPLDAIPMRKMSFFGGRSYEDANSSLLLYKENDILLGAMRVHFHRVCISAQDGITRSTTIIMRPKNPAILPYLYQAVNSDETIAYAVKQSGKSQQPYVNWESELENYSFSMPPEQLALLYSDKISSMIEKVKLNERENYYLTALRDFLLPLLMNGQVTVKPEEAHR